MNQELFKSCLLRFNSYIGGTQSRKVALLLLNATFCTIENFLLNYLMRELFSYRQIRTLVRSQWILE